MKSHDKGTISLISPYTNSKHLYNQIPQTAQSGSKKLLYIQQQEFRKSRKPKFQFSKPQRKKCEGKESKTKMYLNYNDIRSFKYTLISKQEWHTKAIMQM